MRLPPACARHLALLALSICCSTAFAHSARAHAKIELQTCEDLEVAKKQYGVLVVELANYFDKSQVWATADFAVGEDTVGARAADNTAAGQGKVSICREVDDDWKCVGQSNQWAANTPFNGLFENPAPAGVDFIDIVFYRRGADGKDVEFVNEYQQNIGMDGRRYATVGDELRLPAGAYSVYVIAWGKREVTEHRGNLTEYFAKTVLTVK